MKYLATVTFTYDIEIESDSIMDAYEDVHQYLANCEIELTVDNSTSIEVKVNEAKS